MHQIVNWIVETVGTWGYPGIVIMMMIESSFFPFPSEVVMIPAGYLAQQGRMNLYLAILLGIAGSLLGAYFNYYISAWVGRPFLLKYGRYFFLPEKQFLKVDAFFNRHGEITTFVGRLIPGIRQVISVPAGLARMNVAKFSFYTALGAGIWVAILAFLGYCIGENKALIERYSHRISAGLVIVSTPAVFIYILIQRKQRNRRDVG